MSGRLKARLDAGVSLGRDAAQPVPRELLDLLRGIRKHGSLGLARREVGMSHRYAHALIARWETITGRKLAMLARGRGSALTPFGLKLAGIEAWLHERVGARFASLSEELADHLDVPQEAAAPRLRMRASHDLAVLKLHERLAGQLAIDLRFQGGLASLDALARGEVDFAGFHVPDPPSLLGPLLPEYRSRLEGRGYRYLRLITRHQGMIVAHGNPRRIRSLADLARPGLRLANREHGSGTRLLFDALLAAHGIAADAIEGYESEGLTHVATAARVRSGSADVAFGIEAAARAHDLGFVPVANECYYLAARGGGAADDALDTLARAADTVVFRRAIARIGGYDVAHAPARVTLAQILGDRRARVSGTRPEAGVAPRPSSRTAGRTRP